MTTVLKIGYHTKGHGSRRYIILFYTGIQLISNNLLQSRLFSVEKDWSSDSSLQGDQIKRGNRIKEQPALANQQAQRHDQGRYMIMWGSNTQERWPNYARLVEMRLQSVATSWRVVVHFPTSFNQDTFDDEMFSRDATALFKA